jgi:hypothetical protein
MRKLTLNIDTLAVESFQTGAARESLGTVEGHFAVTCAYDSCTPYPSLHNTRCGCTPAVYVQANEAATRPEVCDPFTLPPRCA